MNSNFFSFPNRGQTLEQQLFPLRAGQAGQMRCKNGKLLFKGLTPVVKVSSRGSEPGSGRMLVVPDADFIGRSDKPLELNLAPYSVALLRLKANRT